MIKLVVLKSVWYIIRFIFLSFFTKQGDKSKYDVRGYRDWKKKNRAGIKITGLHETEDEDWHAFIFFWNRSWKEGRKLEEFSSSEIRNY